jgi:asparagine synthase (glutamine-hydrolysing)
MSGLVGILNLDGSMVDRGLMARMTEFLAFRGPDGRRAHVSKQVGLGHALLKTTAESCGNQPFTLDGRRWIVADARVDAQQDLIAKLRAREQADLGSNPADVELILRAYCVWGQDCVEHLLGDFTFAVWDEQNGHLFCARDHLGVKPFFYAELQQSVVFSNTLDCIRQHPLVSRDLNDSTIADFLLFGANQDARTTSFRDIRRLPSAHCITWSKEASRCRRYWTLPVEEPVHYKRPDEYPERFTELLQTAVRDRLRTRRVGVLMSGGLDSPTLAAAALNVLREHPGGFRLQAMTSVYDRLIPDSERHYAGLVADYLDIPIQYDVRDDETSILQWDQVSIRTPEPVDNPPAFAASVAFSKKMAARAKVFFYGEGPDNALQYEWWRYLKYLVGKRRVALLVRALLSDVRMHRRLPLWSSVRQIAGAGRQERRWREAFPRWLNQEFAARHGCRERWDARHHRQSSSIHPVRPVTYELLSSLRWQSLFEDCDINGALSHTEMRHPFLDLRLLQFMLVVPAMPWCRNKLIIRRSMRTSLPAGVLRRKKASLSASPDFRRVVDGGLPRLAPAPDLLRYVNPGEVPTVPKTDLELRSTLRPLGLNYWLHNLTDD